MDYECRVRGGNGIGDRSQEPDAGRHVQALRVTILSDRPPTDELHGHPAFAILNAHIDQACDRGMFESSEDSGFTKKLSAVGRSHTIAQNLDCDDLRHSVRSLRTIDRTHAADTEAFKQAKRPVFTSNAIGSLRLGRANQNSGHRAVRVRDGKQPLDHASKLRTRGAFLSQERPALAAW